MALKEFLIVTALAHTPQLYKMVVEKKSMREARTFSDPDKFFTPVTIAWHVVGALALFWKPQN